MTGAVLKTVVTEHLGQAGSIPVRLRQTRLLPASDRPVALLERCDVPDPRRATPRTDAVLADPRLLEAAARLGPALVKRAVTVALDRCRAGEVAR